MVVKIRFINHASFEIIYGDISFISDLWIEGRVFNNSWNLLSESRLKYSDFERVNYIWFSHEHPDHFFPPNLDKIPKELKQNITILYQKTIDKRVVNYCSNAGFKKTIELNSGHFYSIADNFKILCEPATEGDSWICYKIGNLTILNINDCSLKDPESIISIKSKIGCKIDILLSKFSYASWAGNDTEKELLKAVSREKLNYLKLQVDLFCPEITIPIASFFYFCHEDNFYMNEHINTAHNVFDFLSNMTNTYPVILYPGDEYSFDLKYDSKIAIAMYKKDYDKIVSTIKVKTEPITIEKLIVASNEYISKLNSWMTKYPSINNIIYDLFVYLKDYKISILISVHYGIKECTVEKNNCDVVLSSEALLYCFQHPYGYESVRFGVRFQKTKNGNYPNFFNFFRIWHLISRGDSINPSYFLFNK